ncbi:hypothetical protein BH11GEM1_BH11GEM1_32380 [soil metagenome]
MTDAGKHEKGAVVMSRPRGVRQYWPQLLCALAVGIAEPRLELAWKCRQGFGDSEACVWGRAFLPLGRWLAPVVVTPVALGVLLILAWAWRAVAARGDASR